MHIKNKKIYSQIFIFSLTFILLFSFITADSFAVNENIKNKKAIIFIMDQISLEELENANTPNIDRLMENGAIGFINTRDKSSPSNKGSRYLSLGMGTRTLGSSQGRLAFGRDEIVNKNDYLNYETETKASDLYKLYLGKEAPEGEILNIGLADIYRQGNKTTPNNEIGLFGKRARENNFKIGILGNSDNGNISRESTMLAMDENGVIPLGYVDNDLLSYDENIIGNIKLNPDRMMEEFNRIINDTDILFIDYGDTSRQENTESLAIDEIKINDKIKSIERGDNFLGKVIDSIDMENTLFMVVSPNPSTKMIQEGNFGLTPIIISEKNINPGLLSSKTTRRNGLVTNFDFGPTIFNYLTDKKIDGFIGESIYSIDSENNVETLSKNYSDYIYLRNNRKVFHWGYIILAMLTILLAFIPKFTKWKTVHKSILKYMSITVFTIPLTMMTVSIFGYKNIFIDMIYVFLGGFLIGFILNKIFKNTLKTIMALGFLTSAILLFDTFIFKNLMIISPLGSDAIAGGRFYGVGNDYMGILLGSIVLSLFIFYDNYKINKNIMLILSLTIVSIIILGLSPIIGANMGGTLSAMVVLLLSAMMILEKKLSFKKIFIVLCIVVVGILLVATFDSLFNPNPTHAGKAMKALLTGGGFGKLFEIISTKLRQVFWNLAYASWNIVLFLQIILFILLYKFKKSCIKNLKMKNEKLFKGFTIILFTSIAIFGFNDTGTIAAALILLYLTIPLGTMVNGIK